MRKLNLPLIKTDFPPPKPKDFNLIIDSLTDDFRNGRVDKEAARIQKKWLRCDEPFRIDPRPASGS